MTTNYIINDMTPEIMAKYALPSVGVNAYRVYFDFDSKNIVSITNEPDPRYNTYFEVNYDEVEKFLTAKETFYNYKIVITSQNKFEIVPKFLDYGISSTILVNILEVKEHDDAILQIKNNLIDRRWTIELNLDDGAREQYRLVNYRIGLFITSSLNKNFLYRTMSVDLKELVEKGSVAIDHQLDVESLPSKIHLSSIQFFKKYSLRTVYESEIQSN
jgi:hypothetical protein